MKKHERKKEQMKKKKKISTEKKWRNRILVFRNIICASITIKWIKAHTFSSLSLVMANEMISVSLPLNGFICTRFLCYAVSQRRSYRMKIKRNIKIALCLSHYTKICMRYNCNDNRVRFDTKSYSTTTPYKNTYFCVLFSSHFGRNAFEIDAAFVFVRFSAHIHTHQNNIHMDGERR